MTYLYQEHGRFFAQIAHPVEEVGAAELEELGATGLEPRYRGVHFRADPQTLYDIVYRARIPTRVLAPLVTFDCHSDNYLYRRASELDWPRLIGTRTFAIFATVTHSRIRHSKYAALKLKDAIVDKVREVSGVRPSVERHDPDVSLNLHVDHNRATISLDVAGSSLHRRGYRTDALEAPMQETVAATILRMSEWSGDQPLWDPMCGSGTIAAEALMLATRTPAQYLRKQFGFEQLPDFDPKLWKRRRAEADSQIRSVDPALIRASDVDPDAARMTRSNLVPLPGGDAVAVLESDFAATDGVRGSNIVVNPPYGLRLGKRNRIGEFYREFGDFLKQRCQGSVAFIYVGKPELLKSVGLRPAWKKKLRNGNLDGRLARFDLY